EFAGAASSLDRAFDYFGVFVSPVPSFIGSHIGYFYNGCRVISSDAVFLRRLVLSSLPFLPVLQRLGNKDVAAA
ncbi:4071_t:CDS:2, partial [Gigaspora rosea]